MQEYEALEQELAEWCGVPDVVACSSGTAALHLALEALRLPPGSEVIVPTLTMVACARAVVLAGLWPVFVDCGEDLLLDQRMVYEAVSPRTSAIMAVHVYGRRCHMGHVETAAVTGHRPIAVVEDLAEAHGISPHRSTDAACWSFFRNKIVAGEEGGAVAFRNPTRAAPARRLRNLGFTDAHDFEHVPRGMNYRLANLLAAPIRASLRRVKESLTRRRQTESWYDRHCPEEWRMPGRDRVWCYDLRIPGLTSERQTALVRALQAEGIAARHAFRPMHLQEEFRHCRRVGSGVAERMAREVVYLPCDPDAVTEDTAARAFVVIRSEVGR